MKRALHPALRGLLFLSGLFVLPALAEEVSAPAAQEAPAAAEPPAPQAPQASASAPDADTAAPPAPPAPPPALVEPLAPAPTARVAAPGLAASGDMEILRRELEDARQELSQLRSEMRAHVTTQSALQGWQEPWIEQKQKLKFFVLDGYFRVRPELFHQLNLGRAPDPSGYTLFPTHSPGASEKTFGGVNMRLRLEPTLNISEQVRVRMQVDALDNVVFGSTPDYAFSSGADGYAWDRKAFGLFSNSQSAPSSGINALQDALLLKRVWGEVFTPLGAFYFGRMPSHWGLGMLRNDGSCLDCNGGDTVDRFVLEAEPWAGWYIAPFFEINIAGVLSSSDVGSGQPMALSTRDSSYTWGAAFARKDTEAQRKAKLAEGSAWWNYGLHFSWRSQSYDAADYYEAFGASNPGFIPRKAYLITPDVWVKYERPNFRLELEAAAVFGSISNRATTFADANRPGQNQSLQVAQFGAVLQGEYQFYKGDLSLKAEIGFASGDKAAGFGNYPRRKVSGPNNTTRPGDIDGPQYACQDTGGCTDKAIRNFRFNGEYTVDMLLFKEILGGITDAFYLKPTVQYRIVDGLDVFGSLIYSQAIYGSSTPSASTNANGETTGNSALGVELNLGARYESSEGFFVRLDWGILFPLAGFEALSSEGIQKAKTANAVRGALGIRF